MPHVIVKLWPGKSEAQKNRLAERITEAVTEVLHYGDESVSVAFEEISAKDWKKKVYRAGHPGPAREALQEARIHDVERGDHR